MVSEVNTIDKVYFIGIGGIGMSAIARHLNSKGVAVYGYDKTETKLTKKLVSEGMIIHYEDDISMIPEGIELVIYTPAIPDDHKELNHFIHRGYKVVKRAEMLGIISRSTKCIAIAGTHGKTSTSSMTAHLLKYGGEDIAAFLGGIMSNYESNYIEGSGDHMVVEADEYDRSFLHLHPTIAVVTSMDADHLDIYGEHDEMIKSFNEFIRQIKDGGILMIEKEAMSKVDEYTLTSLGDRDIKISVYGDHEDIRYEDIKVVDGKFGFDYISEEECIRALTLGMPGRHNVANATAAITIALEIGLDPEQIRSGLSTFKGIKRRFEKIAEARGRVYYDDYAHHPTELRAAIGAVRALHPDRKITGIFQPHLYSRTRDFADGFAEALDELDDVLLLDIYPARELPIDGVDAALIADKMKNKNVSITTKELVINKLKERKLEVVITLGAGDIDTCVPRIKTLIEDE